MKVVNVQDRRRSTGRLFHARGPETAKARSPMVERCIAGTRTSAVDAERSRRRESTSDSDWINSDRYYNYDVRGGDKWSYKMCEAPVKSSPSTNQHPTFYGPDALPAA